MPEFEVKYLTQLGWTAAQVQDLQAGLEQQGAMLLGTPGLATKSLQVSALASAYSAIHSLGDSVRVRVGQLGLSVRDLTQAQRDVMKSEQDLISMGLASQIPSQSLLDTVEGYIADVRRLVLDTNNVANLQAALDFGYDALVHFQQLDAGPSGLRSFIDGLESAGRIDHALATSFRTDLAEVEVALEKGDFSSAGTSLGGMLKRITQQRGIAIPTDVADSLTAYGTYSQSLLPTPTLAAPAIQSLQRLGFHWQPTRVSLTFNEALAPSPAQNLTNYQVFSDGSDGKFGTRDDRIIDIASVIYDPVTNTVTISPKHRLNLHRRYMLVVNGLTPTGVSDVSGNLVRRQRGW